MEAFIVEITTKQQKQISVFEISCQNNVNESISDNQIEYIFKKSKKLDV